jgi:hypothetical protein
LNRSRARLTATPKPEPIRPRSPTRDRVCMRVRVSRACFLLVYNQPAHLPLSSALAELQSRAVTSGSSRTEQSGRERVRKKQRAQSLLSGPELSPVSQQESPPGSHSTRAIGMDSGDAMERGEHALLLPEVNHRILLCCRFSITESGPSQRCFGSFLSIVHPNFTWSKWQRVVNS